MNALTNLNLFSTHLPRPQNRGAVAPPIARPRRERDFGIGYGSSSGYANTTAAPYAPNPTTSRFRFG